MRNFIKTAASVIFSPKRGWNLYDDQVTPRRMVMLFWVVPMALIPAVATFFAVRRGFTLDYMEVFIGGAGWGMWFALVMFAGLVVGVRTTAWGVSSAIPGAPFKTSYTIAAGAATPTFVGGAFLAFPQVWWLFFAGVAWSLCLLWTGLGAATRSRTMRQRLSDWAGALAIPALAGLMALAVVLVVPAMVQNHRAIEAIDEKIEHLRETSPYPLP
jgi:hypothetical protein